MLAVARAVATKPALLLDEISMSLAPLIVEEPELAPACLGARVG